MSCLTPIVIKRKNYADLLKRGITVTSHIKVPCGHCVGCLKSYVQKWSYRIYLHSLFHKSIFVTLTYNDDFLPENGVSLEDIKKFHQRLKKAGKNFGYVLISEYGPNGHRPHYHAIYFDLCEEDIKKYWSKYGKSMGFSLCECLLPERIAYVCSFHILKNKFVPKGKSPNFKLVSRGIGLDAFCKFELVNAVANDWKYLYNYYGYKVPIDRYFRKRQFVDVSDFDPDTINFNPHIRINAKDWNDAVRYSTERYVKNKMFNKITKDYHVNF